MTFLGNLKSAITNLNSARDATDGEVTAKLAHSLVALSGQLGFIKLSNAAHNLETACLSNGAIDVAVEQLETARKEALEVLKDLLETKAGAEEDAAPCQSRRS